MRAQVLEARAGWAVLRVSASAWPWCVGACWKCRADASVCVADLGHRRAAAVPEHVGAVLPGRQRHRVSAAPGRRLGLLGGVALNAVSLVSSFGQ